VIEHGGGDLEAAWPVALPPSGMGLVCRQVIGIGL
jgi:hypothetical protein